MKTKLVIRLSYIESLNVGGAQMCTLENIFLLLTKLLSARL